MSDSKEHIYFTIELLTWLRSEPQFQQVIKAGLPIEIFPHFKVNIYHRNNDQLDSIFFRFKVNNRKVNGTFNKGYLTHLLNNPSFELFEEDAEVLRQIRKELYTFENFNLYYSKSTVN